MKHTLKKLVRRYSVLRKTAQWMLMRVHYRRHIKEWESIFKRSPPTSTADAKLVIFGWYGTETTGDKFILLGWLIAAYKQDSDLSVEVLSMDPKVTRDTLRELVSFVDEERNDLKLGNFLRTHVQVYSESRITTLNEKTILVLGGGPIMDDPILAKWNLFLDFAKARRAISIIGGCGYGPVRVQFLETAALNLLSKADRIILRNHIPKRLQHRIEKPYQVLLDPAFITYPLIQKRLTKKTNSLAINSRHVPANYTKSKACEPHTVTRNTKQYIDAAMVHLKGLQTITHFSTHESGSITDLEMGQAVVAELLDSHHGLDQRAALEPTVQNVAAVLRTAKFVVSTRFHGFILALMSGCKVAGLDYAEETGKTALFYTDYYNHVPSSNVYEFRGFEHNDMVDIESSEQLTQALDESLTGYPAVLKEFLTQTRAQQTI